MDDETNYIESEAIFCFECGTQISEEAKFFPNCGIDLLETDENMEDQEFECSECGTFVSSSDKICPNCSRDVSEAIDVATTPQNFGFNWGAFALTPLWLLFHGKKLIVSS